MAVISMPVVLVIMGVSGSGKSTIGALLAQQLGWPFEEGDSLHPLANIEKMSEGIPLTDEDRWPWLAKVADWIDKRLDTGESGVVTCSALKHAYRTVLNRRGSGVEFVYLSVDREELDKRVEHREGHFMPASLLDSQLATLEPPTAAEPAIIVEARTDARLVVDRILRDLGLTAKTVRGAKSATSARPAQTAQSTRSAKPTKSTNDAKSTKPAKPPGHT